MRVIIATIAAVLAVSLSTPIASFAAKKQTAAVQKRSQEECLALAKQRGFTVDPEHGRGGARFIKQCMAGKVH
jgi:hypothetical protein